MGVKNLLGIVGILKFANFLSRPPTLAPGALHLPELEPKPRPGVDYIAKEGCD